MNNQELKQLNDCLTVSVATQGNSFMKTFRYGFEKNYNQIQQYKELILYSFVLDGWKQYNTGQPLENNHITKDDFDIMVNRIKQLVY